MRRLSAWIGPACGLALLVFFYRSVLFQGEQFGFRDAAHFYYRDIAGTKRAAEWAAQLGFSGKSCLSPVQVPPVNAAFTPTAEEIHWARDVLDALDEAASNDLAVAVSQGMMVDAPHAAQARRILERADGYRVEHTP